MSLAITVTLSGGCELLFHTSTLTLTDVAPGTTLGDLVKLLRGKIVERPEHFLVGDGLRPGILSLVNDTDSELLGGPDYELENKDQVSFISTLHGG
jgi:ubiquitin related modifier 1